MANKAQVSIFFCCGAPKSGTTWLQRILDAHPHVVCSGEGAFIEKFTVPLAKVIKDYNAHQSLVAERVYQGKPVYPLLNQADFDDLARHFILRHMGRRVNSPAVRWLGDKTPRYTLYLEQLLRLFPAARFFHIVRDPRDVTVSRLHHALRAGYKDALVAGSDQYNELIRNAATAWRDNVATVRKFIAANRAPVHELYYEELLARPAEQIARLFDFLSVDQSAATVQSVIEQTSFETLSGGRKPGEEDPTSFFRKGIAGDWQGKLDEHALAIIDEVCGELMRQHGYVEVAA